MSGGSSVVPSAGSPPSSTYEELFLLIDTDGGGTLSLEEVQQFCEKLGLPSPPSPQVIARLFVQADADRSNAIDKEEFTALCEGIKLVVGLSEKQMVDAYAAHEIRRLFSYLCTNNGLTMRRDELRKAVDILNHALHLEHPDTAINAMLRDTAEVDFEGFRSLLTTKLCPDRSLTSVANVFLLEERRRREHLIRVKSMYERSRNRNMPKGGARDSDQASDADGGESRRCAVCPLKDQHIETLSQQIASLLEEKRALETKVRDIGDAAMREVQFTQTIQKLQSQIAEEADRYQTSVAIQDALRKQLSDLHSKMAGHEVATAAHTALAQERDQLAQDFAMLEKENESVRLEVQTLQDRLQRKTAEVAEQQIQSERLRSKLQERDEHIGDLERRESEVHVKEIESLRMQRLMAEMRERCEKRERELDALEREVAEQRFRLVEREQALEHREDVTTALERQVRRYEVESHDRWETVFRRAQQELDLQQEQLQLREMEVVNREAEMRVREQIFDANQRKAEATSLPERERRLKMLQNIEQNLAQRERHLRQPERDMVRSMLQPELLTLREENLHLQSQAARQRTELESLQGRLKEESEKYRAERQLWIEKSKARLAEAPSISMQGSFAAGGPAAALAAATSSSFATSRTRRQSIMGMSGGSPAVAAASPPRE